MMPELPRNSLTIGDHIAQGSRFIEVICGSVNCHHARHGFDARALSSELSFKEAGRRFRCTKCGAKAAWCRPDVKEFYEKLTQQPSQMES